MTTIPMLDMGEDGLVVLILHTEWRKCNRKNPRRENLKSPTTREKRAGYG